MSEIGSEGSGTFNLNALQGNISSTLSVKDQKLREASELDLDETANLVTFQAALGEWNNAVQMTTTIVKVITDSHKQIIQSMG